MTTRGALSTRVNTVFQDYALFPHMDVARNVEYGLRVRKVPKAERRERAERALEMVSYGSVTVGRPSSPAASASGWRSPERS